MYKFLILLGLTCTFSCLNDDDSQTSTLCDATALEDNALYNYEGSTATIEAVTISDDCLFITYSASGCDGSTWNEKLIDSEDIAESNPPQRYIKLAFTNTEICTAYITKGKSFDLSPLQVEGMQEIVFHLQGWNEPIVYNY